MQARADEQVLPRGEVPVEGGRADARLAGDALERHVQPVRPEDRPRRLEHADAVADGISTGHEARIHEARIQVFGALRWLAVEELRPAELFARLARLSGYDLFACTRTRRPLLPGVPVPPEDRVPALPARPDAPPSIPGGFAVPVATAAEPTAGHVVALERDGARPSGLAVVQHGTSASSSEADRTAVTRGPPLRPPGKGNLTPSVGFPLARPAPILGPTSERRARRGARDPTGAPSA